jgi:phosphoribosyl-ATP pyrophosphohydrolase/phosphoribosyl-AMP cyclohydrolase
MTPDFNKYADGLMPAIVQDARTNKVLMLGFMNKEAWELTLASRKISFFSRSKQRLWTKGETSGNFLLLENILLDCDNDTFLLKALPTGPVCHTGADTCFNEINDPFDLFELERVIHERKVSPSEKSYTSSLFNAGINKVAQKLGEEAIELVIEAKDDNEELFLNESADLLFHYLVLLQAKDQSLDKVIAVLKQRHR